MDGGTAQGALAAMALTRSIQTLLFGVGRFDATAFAAMSAVMLFVALVASYVLPIFLLPIALFLMRLRAR